MENFALALIGVTAMIVIAWTASRNAPAERCECDCFNPAEWRIEITAVPDDFDCCHSAQNSEGGPK